MISLLPTPNKKLKTTETGAVVLKKQCVCGNKHNCIEYTRMWYNYFPERTLWWSCSMSTSTLRKKIAKIEKKLTDPSVKNRSRIKLHAALDYYNIIDATTILGNAFLSNK